MSMNATTRSALFGLLDDSTDCSRPRAFGGLMRGFALAAAAFWAPLAGAQSVISLSPDVTIPLGAADLVTPDHAIAVDNQLGIVALQNLGVIPEAADLTGYAEGAAGTKLLAFDTTVALAGGVVARPGDVVALSGASYSIAFSGAGAGLPPGVQVDALAASTAGGLLLSFDTAVSLPGGLHVADEDLVRWNGTSFALALDGSAAGMSSALDVDAVDDLGPSKFLISFDTAGSIGAISFSDEDVLRHSAGVWTLERDGSTADSDWGPADLDAMQMVPEPGKGAMEMVGALGLAAGFVRRRRLVRRLGAGAALFVAGTAGLVVAPVAPVWAGDGVLEIHQTCAVTAGCFPGDAAGFPVTITTSGSYRLTSNLTMPDAFSSGIRVGVDDVTIDLAGFAIVGLVTCSGTPLVCAPSVAGGNGIERSGSTQGVRVRNGSIRGMGSRGILLGEESEISNLRSTSNRAGGIEVGIDSVVSGNVAAENGTVGIAADGGSIVTRNVVARNATTGILCSTSNARTNGFLAAENTVYQNGADGITATKEAPVVVGNTVYDNGQSGVIAGDGALVNGNAIVSNTDFGLENDASLTVGYSDNLLRSNGSADVEASTGLKNRGGNSCGGTTTCP